MRPDASGYAVFSVVFGTPMAVCIWQSFRLGLDYWSLVWVLVGLWGCTMVFVAGHKVSVSADTISVRKVFGWTVDIPLARITHVAFKRPSQFGHNRGAWMVLVLHYRSDAADEREIWINPKFYSRDDNRRLLQLLGYETQHKSRGVGG